MADQQNLFATYIQPDLEFVRGEGVRLYDSKGNDYLDFMAGIAVNSVGHAHPHLVSALNEQAGRLWHLSNMFKIPGQQKLAERLCANCFADKVFFANSGAEALECAFKAARRYHWARGNPERVNILSFEGSFHGRTLATIAAGGQDKYREGFGPRVEGFISLPFGDHDALKAAIDENTAAILIEPVQGEGGIRPVPHQCLRGLRQLCDEHGILLIYDEVQTGLGRTGKFFAHQWASRNGASQKDEGAPDILAVAKGLGGGFPIGACLTTEVAAEAMTIGTHGTTFGGNPLAMAVGNAVLDIVLENGFIDQINERAKRLQQILAEIVDTYPNLVEDVRGTGLLMGLKARIANTDIIAALRDQRLLAVVAGDNVVRFAPPLIVSDDDLSQMRERLIAGLEQLSEQAKKAG